MKLRPDPVSQFDKPVDQGLQSMQVHSPYFVAGLDFDKGVVVKAAPILNYMKGWTRTRVELYVSNKRGWSWL